MIELSTDSSKELDRDLSRKLKDDRLESDLEMVKGCAFLEVIVCQQNWFVFPVFYQYFIEQNNFNWPA